MRAEGLRVDADLAEAEVAGSRALLERMVGNLIENAVRHNVANGWVRVRTGSVDQRAFLEVANSGPLVPHDSVDALFEPFRRAESRMSSDGVGLGLSIVRAVGEAHNATLDARAGIDGGLVVTLTMPCRTNGAIV